MYEESHYAGIRTALATLIHSSLETQVLWKDKQDHGAQYVDSFCTVKFGGPRRMGHTTAMVQVGNSMFHNPAFFCLSEAMAHNLADLGVPKEQRYSIRSNIESHLRGKEHDAVFVDCSFFASKEAIGFLREYVATMVEKFETACLILLC